MSWPVQEQTYGGLCGLRDWLDWYIAQPRDPEKDENTLRFLHERICSLIAAIDNDGQ